MIDTGRTGPKAIHRLSFASQESNNLLASRNYNSLLHISTQELLDHNLGWMRDTGIIQNLISTVEDSTYNDHWLHWQPRSGGVTVINMTV